MEILKDFNKMFVILLSYVIQCTHMLVFHVFLDGFFIITVI